MMTEKIGWIKFLEWNLQNVFFYFPSFAVNIESYTALHYSGTAAMLHESLCSNIPGYRTDVNWCRTPVRWRAT